MIVSFFGKGHNILNNFISIGWKICTMSVQKKSTFKLLKVMLCKKYETKLYILLVRLEV